MSIRFPNRAAQRGTYHAQDGATPAYLELDGNALSGMRAFADASLADGDQLGISVVSVTDATIWEVIVCHWRASDGALVQDSRETLAGALTDLETIEATACATEAMLTAAYGGPLRLNAGSYLPEAPTVHFTLQGQTAPTPAFGVIYATANDLGTIEQNYLGPSNWSDLSQPIISWEAGGYWQFNLTTGSETIELEPIGDAKNARQFSASVAVSLYIPASAPSGAQLIYLFCGEHGAPENWGNTGESVGTNYTVGVATTVTLHCTLYNSNNVFLKGLDAAVANGYRITSIVLSSASL